MTGEAANTSTTRTAGAGLALGAVPSDDAYVMLDPAVEVLPRDVGEYRLLCHRQLSVGMAVPPGDGLLDFIQMLEGSPVAVGALRNKFDDQRLIDEMLGSLHTHGFLHVTSPAEPSTDELRQLRSDFDVARKGRLRRTIFVDLDAEMSLESICTRLGDGDGTIAPEVVLRCDRLADHRLTLDALARLRRAGAIRLYASAIWTPDLTSDEGVRESIFGLGASVVLEGVDWPGPSAPVPGLVELTRSCIAVHALMKADLSLLDEGAQRRALTWAGASFLSGLCLQLDADDLWPDGRVEDDEFVQVFEAVEALESQFGDVQIVGLPSDEVLLGHAADERPGHDRSALADRFNSAYLRWRIVSLKACELDNTFSQTPEAEEKLVRIQEDLLPSHPELLLLRPGSLVVDVCGGVGRVARRLAPRVGEDGAVFSFEMLRCVSSIARSFACEKDLTNVHFRPGLAQRLPLPDATVDAAVNEWTAGIWELGLGRPMVDEMTRVVRPGGRIAVTHRLVRLPLTRLGHYWAQYEDIYDWMSEAFLNPSLTILVQRVWGQLVPTLVGENASDWRKQYLPRVIDPFDVTYDSEEHVGPHCDVYLTIVAERN